MKMLSRAGKRAVLMLCCGAALAAVPGYAQTDGPPPPPPGQDSGGPPPGGPRGGGPGRRLEMLQHELNLTPDQSTKVQAMMESERTKMQALQSNSALSGEERRTQMMAIRHEEDASLRSILTPEQITKYDAMQARMRERGRERQQGGEAPPPPPPSSDSPSSAPQSAPPSSAPQN